MSPPEVVSIGECMVELARGSDGRFGLSYGGDTFNTAVYLARCGISVAYATRLGDDPYSAAIIDLAKAEGIRTEHMARTPGRMPGLYIIETTAGGERTFHYWRDRSPARELFETADARTVIEAIEQARMVYLSGITLSLYAPAGLDQLFDALTRAKAAGALIAMDGNYRPRGWAGETERARAVMKRFWPTSHIALPTFEDEAALWGDTTPDDTITRLQDLGIREVVVKQGPAGAIVAGSGDEQRSAVPVPERVTAIDTSAAGDSFNAAYLAARLRNKSPREAAHAGHCLAGVVVQHRGAIAPREATAKAIVRS